MVRTLYLEDRVSGVNHAEASPWWVRVCRPNRSRFLDLFGGEL